MDRDEMHNIEIMEDLMGPSLTPEQKRLIEELSAMNIGPEDALVLIDVQNDFMPGGALAVPGGDEILPMIEVMVPMFENLILTQDWHPADHASFAEVYEGKAPFEMVELRYGEQVLWPTHCVMGSKGAEFKLPQVALDRAQMILRKGYNRDIDSYSAFIENDKETDTGLAGTLRERGIKRIFVAGLATDFCVAFSAMDGRAKGFEVVLVEAACRGIDPDGIAQRKRDMKDLGVEIIAAEPEAPAVEP